VTLLKFVLRFSVLLLFAPAVYAQELQNGDLIFHKSLGNQALAIAEAQGSPYTHMGVVFKDGENWFVYEAIQPVKKTPIRDWVRRGKDRHFVVKRVRAEVLDMSDAQNQRALKAEVLSQFGRDYDIFFQWSDDRTYCSELVFKAYFRALNLGVGAIQATGSLNLDGPNIRKMIQEREKLMGKPIDLEEPIVTPVSMLQSEFLELIY
jgi:Permuted papain-like amidase enzyme, YaeF/YiiX, C92 family